MSDKSADIGCAAVDELIRLMSGGGAVSDALRGEEERRGEGRTD